MELGNYGRNGRTDAKRGTNIKSKWEEYQQQGKSLSLTLSLSLCVSLCVSLCLSLTLSICLSPCMSLCPLSLWICLLYACSSLCSLIILPFSPGPTLL